MKFFKFFSALPAPFQEGFCSVGDGHEIHYMAFGNPKGRTVIRFHGGPGGGASAHQATAFDLKKYRVLLFDQRGCKLSTSKDIYRNNTPYAAAEDAIKLLKHLKWPIKNLIVAGSSYGATLALLSRFNGGNASKNQEKRVVGRGLFSPDFIGQLSKYSNGAFLLRSI